jgi:Arc/MetJ family transcription regulator
MATNLDIDVKRLDEAKRLGGHKTKKAAVNAALDDYVRRLRQREIVKLFGTVDYYDDYDYKALRKRR